jgi:hypothetical protein
VAGRIRNTVGWFALALVAFAPAAARAQVKSANVPGFSFSQLTVNGADDHSARVSPNGNIAWIAAYNLPGASSSDGDFEVMLWNGASIVQITDDALVQERVVVNDFGDMAWQVNGSDEASEIVVQIDGVRRQLTSDPAPGIIDRYPDINDYGVVVWGRRTSQYVLAIYDGATGAPFVTYGIAYRPHINSVGHIHVAGIPGILDTQFRIVVPMFTPNLYGYREFRRSEINDLDQLAIEAERFGFSYPDLQGPRDILFWNGSAMRTIFRSPGPWHGRADLNTAGVIAWEGYGGLPGSSSSKDDSEIFVYDPTIRQVVQLTDDDVHDQWAGVLGNGEIVWSGNGNYPGVGGIAWDREIFRAIPNADADADGLPNASDNCPLRANPDQADSGGPGSALPDGIGNVCQCGDVSDDGVVGAGDVQALRGALAAGQLDALPAPAKCRVNGAWQPCSVVDVVLLERALASPGGLGPGIEKTCDASLQY